MLMASRIDKGQIYVREPEKPCPWILWNSSVPCKECVNRIDGMVCKLSDLSSKSECVQSVD